MCVYEKSHTISLPDVRENIGHYLPLIGKMRVLRLFSIPHRKKMINFVATIENTYIEMKRILSIAIIAIMAFANMAHAENFADNLEFEAVAGINAANISYNTVVSRVGFHAGVRASKDFKFFTEENAIYGNAAALISLKGGKLKDEFGTTLFNPYYLEIPVHMGYSHASKNAKFFFEMGPYFAVGLFGKTDGLTVFGDMGFRRFDFGLGLRTGVELKKHYSVSVGFDVGLIHTQPGTGSNKNFYLQGAYKF